MNAKTGRVDARLIMIGFDGNSTRMIEDTCREWNWNGDGVYGNREK